MKTLSLVLLLGLVITPVALAGSKPVLAPLNPDFVKALEERKSGPPVTEDGRVLGHMPSPVRLDHLQYQIPKLEPSVRQLPVSYSICDEGKCPPVLDQGSCGSCWAFGTYGSVESVLRPDEVWDFSENNMIMHHGFNNGPCSGGGRAMATAYLVRWDGPVLESDDPYLDYGSPPGLPEQKHVQEVYWLSGSFDPYNVDQLDYIKRVLMDYGGQYWAYMHSGSYYNSSNAAYYYPGSSSANHAVTLVGWDDEFSKNNFNNTPPADGAFILRNSWGTGFGLDGFFYASYYDASIEVLTSYVSSEELTNYSFIYQHDWLGWTNSLGAGGIDKLTKDPEIHWGANIFEAGTDERLAAASFYTASYNSSYRILVYTDVVDDPSDGTLAGETAGTIEYPGYHTISIDDMNVLLSDGTRFSIVVEFHTPGYDYPVPVERRISGYTSAAEASYGESFIRATENDDWLDLHGEYSNANVCIKAFSQLYCDDGDACTEDTSAGSECVYTPLVCDDQNACTSDSCDSQLGCQATALSDCSLCDNLGVCMSGVCLEGAQNEDTACDDGDACTQLDLCGQGACVGSDPVVCIALDQCHIAGQCDPLTGICSDPNADDGTSCDDADVCTLGDSCQSGVCTSAGPVADGTVCDDEDLCTQQDTCQAGVCTGSDPISCTALDQCHQAGNCNTQTGICSDPEVEDGTACDDGVGDACTQSDSCQAGVCVGGEAVADGSACNDGDLCTQSDSCLAGACTGADPVVCEALDQCHEAGVCDPETGECTDPVAEPDGTECPDGTCQNGECVPGESSSTGCGCSLGGQTPLPGLLPVLLMLMLITLRRRT